MIFFYEFSYRGGTVTEMCEIKTAKTMQNSSSIALKK
jgi:hypothetical protein